MSITDLFLGGIGVGLATSATYIIVIVLRVWLNPALAPAVVETVTWRERFDVLGKAAPVTLLIVGVLGGLFGGLFTATQAGAVGALLSLMLALATRTLDWRGFRASIIDTLVTCGSLFIVVIGASMLTRFLTLSGVGIVITDAASVLNDNPVLLLVVITLIYLVLGMFLEPIGAMLITLPILLPLTAAAGISPLWFGVFVVKLLEIGMITPPIGMNVFVLSSAVGRQAPVSIVFRGVAWFFVADLCLIALLVAVPGIITYLPSLH